MATRLKNKIKDYMSNIWLLEIIILGFLCIYFGSEIYMSIGNDSQSKSFAAIEAVLNPSEYYEKSLKTDSYNLQKMVYDKTNSFEKLLYGDSNTKELLEKNFIYKSYEQEGYKSSHNIYFIIRNKTTNEIVTNDPSQYLEVTDGKYTDQGIRNYIDDKYNEKDLLISFDNEENFNSVVKSGEVLYEKNIISNFEEYYYTSLKHYVDPSNQATVFYLAVMIVVAVFLLIKIITILIKNKWRVNIRGNFIASIIYVLRYGFQYKQTSRTLVLSIIGLIIFFIVYLYLLAIGGYESNVLVTFFRLYPFKGSLILMSLPMIGIIYSVKKTIEISMVNDSLKKINEGDLNYHIVEQGGPEILELIDNINKIKKGYEIAVEDTVKNEKLKTELISNVSHDLRTPLTSIINYVNILKTPEITEEERSDYLKIVDKKSKKLKGLIDDLFEMSKINSGKMKLNKENIDIMSLIHQTVGEYSYLYEDKNIQFSVNSDVEEINMDLDGKMISRAIENIVINALKYSLENTRVYIDVIDHEDEVEISCKNIANYLMTFDSNEIFERFARGDSSRNSKVEGSGLGLAITKSIIELHGGKINIVREGDMFKIFTILPKK